MEALFIFRSDLKSQFENYYSVIYFGQRRDGVVVRASASQSVDLEFISPSQVPPKDLKK